MNVRSAMCDVRCADLDDLDFAAGGATSPNDIIPDASLRRRIERLLAETPTPPDSWIDRELEAHYGELPAGDLIAYRKQCRHYLAAVIGRDQIVNRKI